MRRRAVAVLILRGVGKWDQHPHLVRREFAKPRPNWNVVTKRLNLCSTLLELLSGKKFGTSSKDEYFILACKTDLAWYCLQYAGRELAPHIREHGCGIIQKLPRVTKPIW